MHLIFSSWFLSWGRVKQSENYFAYKLASNLGLFYPLNTFTLRFHFNPISTFICRLKYMFLILGPRESEDNYDIFTLP
jgi:hypothetical protein